MSANLTRLKREVLLNVSSKNLNRASAARVLYELKGGKDKKVIDMYKENKNSYIYALTILTIVKLLEEAKKEVIIGHWTAEKYTKLMAEYWGNILKRKYTDIYVDYQLTNCKLGNIHNLTCLRITRGNHTIEVHCKWGRKTESIVECVNNTMYIALNRVIKEIGDEIALTTLEMRDLDEYIGRLI